MRKLGAKNIKLFIMFLIIVILIVVIFAYGINKVLAYDRNIYSIAVGNSIFDASYNSISTDEDGKVSQSWDGNYYLKIKNGKYNLGSETISFSKNDYRINAYGIIYQIYDDGSVAKKSGKTEIVKNGAPSFYKLADRKYLIVDREIIDNNKDFYAKSFLLVVMNKQGNALLLNDDMNIKTLNSIVLKSSNFVFDVAKETLTYNGNKIDLKKVIGSTNEYVEKIKEKKKDKNDKEDEEDQVIGGNGNINIGGNGNNNGDNNGNVGKINFQKSVSLKNTDPSITYIDVSYLVVDPANAFDSIFITLSDGVNTSRLFLNKDENNYRLLNLKPNSEYTISLGYTYVDKENSDSLTEVIQDVVRVRTKRPDYSITITKVTSDKIYFNLKIDPLYKLESGVLSLYSDNAKTRSIAINTVESATTSGWQSHFEIYEPGYEILLKLEEAVYNGNPVDYVIQTKYVNY